MEKIILFSLIITTLLLLYGCSREIELPEEVSERPTDNFFEIEKEQLYFCEKDQDCVKVIPDCCGCNSGGIMTTINKKYFDDWNYHQRQVCRLDCTNEESQHISCFSEPKCVNNTCKLIPNKELVCDSLLHLNCKHISEDRLDEIKKSNGISCREVIKFCK